MIATFLRGEWRSSRFGARLQEAARELDIAEDLIARPDTADAVQNALRNELLVRFRGWGQYESVFGGLPADDVLWYEADLDHDALHRVEYIQWWIDQGLVTDRRVAVAVESMRAGWRTDPDFEPHRAVVAECKRGRPPVSPILVTDQRMERYVILEGHLRMTAYLLAVTALPPRVPVLLGVSGRIAEWSEW